MQSTCPEIEVQYIDVQKQKGQSDCGLFAIAFATSFAHLQDPASITYDQAKIRTHLIHCFETLSMTHFFVGLVDPVIQTLKRTQSIVSAEWLMMALP